MGCFLLQNPTRHTRHTQLTYAASKFLESSNCPLWTWQWAIGCLHRHRAGGGHHQPADRPVLQGRFFLDVVVVWAAPASRSVSSSTPSSTSHHGLCTVCCDQFVNSLPRRACRTGRSPHRCAPTARARSPSRLCAALTAPQAGGLSRNESLKHSALIIQQNLPARRSLCAFDGRALAHFCGLVAESGVGSEVGKNQGATYWLTDLVSSASLSRSQYCRTRRRIFGTDTHGAHR